MKKHTFYKMEIRHNNSPNKNNITHTLFLALNENDIYRQTAMGLQTLFLAAPIIPHCLKSIMTVYHQVCLIRLLIHMTFVCFGPHQENWTTKYKHPLKNTKTQGCALASTLVDITWSGTDLMFSELCRYTKDLISLFSNVVLNRIHIQCSARWAQSRSGGFSTAEAPESVSNHWELFGTNDLANGFSCYWDWPNLLY